LSEGKLDIAWNNVYRNIFGMKSWESVIRDTVAIYVWWA